MFGLISNRLPFFTLSPPEWNKTSCQQSEMQRFPKRVKGLDQNRSLDLPTYVWVIYLYDLYQFFTIIFIWISHLLMPCDVMPFFHGRVHPAYLSTILWHLNEPINQLVPSLIVQGCYLCSGTNIAIFMVCVMGFYFVASFLNLTMMVGSSSIAMLKSWQRQED